MIAREHDGLAPGRLGILLELHQQVHHLAHVGAAVGVVAGLHEGGAAAGPLQLLVDEPGAFRRIVVSPSYEPWMSPMAMRRVGVF